MRSSMTENSCSGNNLNAAACELLERESERLGLVFAGAAGEETDRNFLSEYGRWLDEGCAGEMGYLREHFPLLRNASSVLPGAVSVLLFALPGRCQDWNIRPETASSAATPGGATITR